MHPMSTPEPTAAEQVRRSMELLWGAAAEPARPAPGPKPGLTLGRIVDAAITLADRDGVDALSMRRVAAELGVGTMSLYRYVPGKAELLALMLDRVNAPDVTAPAGRPWRAALADVARGAYRLYLAHPWLLQVNWARPVLGPNSVAGMEVYMRDLDGLGLTGQERVAVVLMVDAYVVGQARNRIHHDAVTVQSGLSDEEFWRQQYPFLSKAMRSGRYPAMAALDDDAFGMGWDDNFEFGLARILDGMVALVEARRRSP
jgi:AcrR family transcriptional regulator